MNTHYSPVTPVSQPVDNHWHQWPIRKWSLTTSNHCLFFPCFFLSPNTHRSLAENQLENVFWSVTTRPAITEQLFPSKKNSKILLFSKNFLGYCLSLYNWSMICQPCVEQSPTACQALGECSYSWQVVSNCLVTAQWLLGDHAESDHRLVGDQKIISHL